MRRPLLPAILLFLILAGMPFPTPAVYGQDFVIRLQTKNYRAGEFVVLRQYRGKTLVPVDSAKTGQEGKTTISLKASPPSGMYALWLKPSTNIDFFISEGESRNFGITVDARNPVKSLTFSNSRENQVFSEFRRFLESTRAVPAGKHEQDKMMKLLDDFEKTAPGAMLPLFLKAIREPEIADPVIPAFVINREEQIRNYYYRQAAGHFFDNIDFSDKRMLNMPVLEEKTGIYFRRIINPYPDSVQNRIRQFFQKTKANDEVYLWSVRYVYELFREASFAGSTGVCNFIAEKYILKEPERWKDDGFLARVRERTSRSKMNATGTKATDLVLKTSEGKNIGLYTVNAPLTVLYFFNPGCESCIPVTDALLRIYRQYRQKGIRVYAVYTDRNREEWLKYISEKKPDWINVYDPDGQQLIDKKYDIYAIPMIYLLDKNKMVLRKDIAVEELNQLLSGEDIWK